MKVFISQPMRDKTDEQIKEEREKALKELQSALDCDIELIDSFFEGAPHDAKPLWFLGESLKKLSEADTAVFIGDWRNYRGCRMEFEAATYYGISTVDLADIKK